MTATRDDALSEKHQRKFHEMYKAAGHTNIDLTYKILEVARNDDGSLLVRHWRTQDMGDVTTGTYCLGMLAATGQSKSADRDGVTFADAGALERALADVLNKTRVQHV